MLHLHCMILGLFIIWGVAATDIWSDYKAPFPNLEKIVHSSTTLHYLHENGVQSLVNNQIQIGCTSYMKGQQFADLYRSLHESHQFHPILVDYSADRMCFMFESEPVGMIPALHQTMTFLVPLAGIFKVHDSLYNLVEMENENPVDYMKSGQDEDLTAFFLMETSQHEKDENPFMERILKDVLRPENFYKALQLDSFFWSSKSTLDFLSDAVQKHYGDIVLGLDLERAKVWNRLGNDFVAVAIETNGDVCGFRDVNHYFTVKSNEIQFNMRKWMSDVIKSAKDSNQGVSLCRSCLAALISQLAQIPSVNFLAVTKRVELFNYRARSIQQSGSPGSSISSSPYANAGLMGDGQIGSIADTGVDVYSCFFYDPNGRVTPSMYNTPMYNLTYRKVIQYAYTPVSDTLDVQGGHGSHVSGTMVGNVFNQNIQSGDGVYDGVAPNAKLAFFDLGGPNSGLSVPSSANVLYGPGNYAGAKVHSNSWGNYFSGSQYYYGNSVDSYLFSKLDTCIFFASGNAGAPGTLCQQATSKNIIAVGSSESTLNSQNINYLAGYTSVGPTYDQRIKPDLAAPGDSLLSACASGSTTQTCTTEQLTGTSMATPAAAGMGLLIRQYFVDPTNKFNLAVCNTKYHTCKSFSPSGVLVKAVLLHSGTVMQKYDSNAGTALGNPPDFYQGYGRIYLPNVLPLQGVYSHDLFVEDMISIGQNSVIKYTAVIQASNYPLKVTLAWYDAPNVDGTTTKALIQDLDLLVIGPSGQTYYGNGANNNKLDSLNTNEQVVVNNPSLGSWTISVISHALPYSGTQIFALVCTQYGTINYG